MKGNHFGSPFALNQRSDWKICKRPAFPKTHQIEKTPTGVFSIWWVFRDSNPGPTGYEPGALTN